MISAEWWAVLDRLGFAAMGFLLSIMWQSSLLFGATALLAWALRRRSVAARHALWAAALFAAPLLPALGWLGSRAGAPRAELPVMPGYEAPALPRPTSPSPVVRPGPRAAAPVAPAPSMPVAPTAPAAEPAPAPTAEPAAPTPARSPSYPWAVGLVVYVVGAVAFLSLVALGRLRLRRCLRRGRRVCEPRVVGAFAEAARAVGLRRTVALVESGRVEAPIALGLLRPHVLLPVGFAAGLSDGELGAMAAHEVAHVRRNDALVLEAVSVLRALLFFHPLVWVAARQVAALAEQAADDAALAAIGEPTRYARMLARLAVALPARALSTELAAGFILSKSAFLRRVEAILSDRRDQIRRLTRWALAGTLVAVLASLALAVALPLGQKRDRAASTRAEGGPLDIRLVGISPDCSDDILDVEGKPIGTWLSPVDQPWGDDQLRRTFLFSVPDSDDPVLFEPFHEVRVAGTDRPLGGGFGSHVVRVPEGRRLVWSVILDRTYRDAVFGLVNQRATLRAIDVALKYYRGRRRAAELAFTGPFVAGAPVEADGGAPGTLTPREDAGWGTARHAQFDLATTRPLDSNVSLLAYDIDGARHLANRGSGHSGPGGARFEVTVPGLPLARVAALAVGEPCHRATFRGLPLLFAGRPPRAYPEYLDRKAAALGLEGKTPTDVRQHQVTTPAEALRLVAIARGVDIEWVKMALDRGSVDFAALPPAARESIREAARGWLDSPFDNARAAGVTLGLKGRWAEFVGPALTLVAEGGQNPRIEAAAALQRYRKHLAAESVVAITDLLLRKDDWLTSRRLVQCVVESETPATVECLWRLARADEARPWVWFPAIGRLVYLEALTPRTDVERELRLRRILASSAAPGEEELEAQALALLPRLLTPELQRMDPSLFGSVLRLTCQRLERPAATAACIGFLRGVTDFRRADWAIDRICKQLNLWHGTNLGGLGTDVAEETPRLEQHDWPAIAAAAIRWHDGQGNGGDAAPKPRADGPPWTKPVNGLRMRVRAPERVECGEPLVFHLEFQNAGEQPLRLLKEAKLGECIAASWRTATGRNDAYSIAWPTDIHPKPEETVAIAPGAIHKTTWTMDGTATGSLPAGGTRFELLYFGRENTNPKVKGFWTGEIKARARVTAVPARGATIDKRLQASLRDLATLWKLLSAHRAEHGALPPDLYRFLKAKERTELWIFRVAHSSYGYDAKATGEKPLVYSMPFVRGDEAVQIELLADGRVRQRTVRKLPSRETIDGWIDAVATAWRADPQWFRGKGDPHAIDVDFREKVAGEIRRLAAVPYSIPIDKVYPRLDYRRRNTECFSGVAELRSMHAAWCLATGLAHPNIDVRIRCAKALGEVGEPALIPTLLEAARRNADLVPGSEGATLHGVYQHALAGALSKLTRTKVRLRDGQDPEGMRKGIAAWEKWLRHNTAPPKP